jgi:hypothetical protein
MNADVEAVEADLAISDSFSHAPAKEIGVTVTCLMPSATDARFFARAGLLDTKVGREERTIPRTSRRSAPTRR